MNFTCVAAGAGRLPKIRRVLKVGIGGQVEARGIGKVEGLGAELDARGFRNAEFLEDGKIEIAEARTIDLGVRSTERGKIAVPMAVATGGSVKAAGL